MRKGLIPTFPEDMISKQKQLIYFMVFFPMLCDVGFTITYYFYTSSIIFLQINKSNNSYM